MNVVQKNLIAVFERLTPLVKEDSYLAECLAIALDEALDQIAMDDGFGTEQQSDPRGDFRDRRWSILGKVQQ